MNDLTKSIPVEPCGIKLINASNGRPLSWGKVNIHLADVLNPTLEELSDHGAIALYTYGIRNNRPIRGSSTKTSTHSNGLITNGYKHWRDGTVGALGIDIRKVLFVNMPWNNLNDDNGGTSPIQTSLVVTDPGDLRSMIKWLESVEYSRSYSWKLHHKKLNSVIPYHLHLQPNNLKGVL